MGCTACLCDVQATQFDQLPVLCRALSAVFEATGQPPVDAWMFEFGQFLMEWITEEAGYQQVCRGPGPGARGHVGQPVLCHGANAQQREYQCSNEVAQRAHPTTDNSPSILPLLSCNPHCPHYAPRALQLIGRVSDSFPGFAQCLNRLLAQQYTLLGGKPPGLPEAQLSHITASSFVLSVTVPETRGAAAFMSPSVYLGFLDKAASQVFGVRTQFSTIQAVPLPTGGVCRVSGAGARERVPACSSNGLETCSGVGAP